VLNHPLPGVPSIHNNLAGQALVWLGMFWFGTSYDKFKMTSHT